MDALTCREAPCHRATHPGQARCPLHTARLGAWLLPPPEPRPLPALRARRQWGRVAFTGATLTTVLLVTVVTVFGQNLRALFSASTHCSHGFVSQPRPAQSPPVLRLRSF